VLDWQTWSLLITHGLNPSDNLITFERITRFGHADSFVQKAIHSGDPSSVFY
jgi:hypothetical protein